MEDNESGNNTSVEKEEEEEAEEVLKKKISNHPLYEILVDTHMECLKVSSTLNMDHELMNLKLSSRKPSPSNFLCQSELDHFMEAYCCALRELKEALEQPQKEAIACINSIQAQIRELTIYDTAAPDQHLPSTSSSVDSSNDPN